MTSGRGAAEMLSSDILRVAKPKSCRGSFSRAEGRRTGRVGSASEIAINGGLADARDDGDALMADSLTMQKVGDY